MFSEVGVEEALQHVRFPATKLELLTYAFAEFAPPEVIHVLDELPEEEYNSLDAVREMVLRVVH